MRATTRWGGVEAKSLVVTMLVSLMRAACLSLSWWRSSVPALLDRDALDAPLVSYPDALLGAVSQAHWDSPPIAFNLRSAADGFLDHPEFCGVCASALAATRLSERSFFN